MHDLVYAEVLGAQHQVQVRKPMVDQRQLLDPGVVPLATRTGAESSAAFVYAERRDNGDYYYSVTIPSLILATYGGGTGLATQRECLEILGCYGEGKVRKYAEIVAATVLCGELSLGSAIVAEE